LVKRGGEPIGWVLCGGRHDSWRYAGFTGRAGIEKQSVLLGKKGNQLGGEKWRAVYKEGWAFRGKAKGCRAKGEGKTGERSARKMRERGGKRTGKFGSMCFREGVILLGAVLV